MRPDNAHVVCRDSNFSSRAIENTTQFCSALCTGSKAPLWNRPKAELYLPMQTMKSKRFTQALCQVLCSVHKHQTTLMKFFRQPQYIDGFGLSSSVLTRSLFPLWWARFPWLCAPEYFSSSVTVTRQLREGQTGFQTGHLPQLPLNTLFLLPSPSFFQSRVVFLPLGLKGRQAVMCAHIQQLTVRDSLWQPCQDRGVCIYEMSLWERFLHLFQAPSEFPAKKYSLQPKSLFVSILIPG